MALDNHLRAGTTPSRDDVAKNRPRATGKHPKALQAWMSSSHCQMSRCGPFFHLCQGVAPFFHFFSTSGRIPFVDAATLAAFDEACGFHVNNTLISWAACFDDGWPGLSEWWIETAQPAPEVLPVTYGPVVAVLKERMVDYLMLPSRAFVLHVLGPNGAPLNQLGPGDDHGSFILQPVLPAPAAK